MITIPQLSLYLDEDIIKKIEVAAKMKNISLSKYVSETLKEYFSNAYPKGFREVFGSIADDSFVRHEITDFSSDSKREAL